MDHFANGSTGDFAYAATRDLEDRLKLVEDRLGITEERKKKERAARFKRMRELVLMRRKAREAGVTLHQYLSYMQFNTQYASIPKMVVDAYNRGI